jgi:hypothetical protein
MEEQRTMTSIIIFKMLQDSLIYRHVQVHSAPQLLVRILLHIALEHAINGT